MPTYETWLPAWCSVRVRLETDEPITDDAELRRRIVEEGAAEVSICHHCANDMEFEGSFDPKAAEEQIGLCTIERIA